MNLIKTGEGDPRPRSIVGPAVSLIRSSVGDGFVAEDRPRVYNRGNAVLGKARKKERDHYTLTNIYIYTRTHIPRRVSRDSRDQ